MAQLCMSAHWPYLRLNSSWFLGCLNAGTTFRGLCHPRRHESVRSLCPIGQSCVEMMRRQQEMWPPKSELQDWTKKNALINKYLVGRLNEDSD